MRHIAVTGLASGIGASTAALLRSAGVSSAIGDDARVVAINFFGTAQLRIIYETER